jgi:hypothetical protein
METNPDDRYQTAVEAAAALRSLLRPKGVAPQPSAATSAAIASVPAAVPTGITTPKSPPPPVNAGVRLSTPKGDTPRSRWEIPARKDIGILAAVVAAGVLLLAGTFMFTGSSKNEPPASQAAALQTGSGPDPLAAAASTPKSSSSQLGGADAKKGPIQSSGAVDARRSGLVFENPKDGATVGTREELTGRIESSGWPVIFVQADIPGQPWWCQAPVEKVEGGRFTSTVVFGDEFTPSGTRFRIVGIVTPAREDALKFEIGSKAQDLPAGFPQSVVVAVTHR